ncbi:uncharacterized protein LOC129238377 [Anastrepha obliqua]|uniref:uncharacterized protein LOC129238377 n=1 Tax=Anastrepha obliqua TaxID=95512 RepID=UPI00240A693C|nr:uncharacterized protein LOC129238377 [Anastrepha obliqua]
MQVVELIRRLTRLLTDKWATHHTHHVAAATATAAGSSDGTKSEATSTSGGGGMMSKINARHWLHPTSTHSTSSSPSVTPPTATPLATTPIMPLATGTSSATFLPATSATTPTPSVASSASSSSASVAATITTPSSVMHHQQLQQQLQQQQQQLLTSEELRRNTFYRTVCASFQSAILLLDMDTGEISDYNERSTIKDDLGTQRVYKKTSPNCVLTLYLPTREITLSGNNPAIVHGIIYVDPKAIQGYRVYAQLTLTFRYGREDEEVMGLRFCNEAIMSLHQVWPRNEEPALESLSPMQEALVKRLGDGAHPFTLTLTPQAPPSVQLVPAKRYFGAPIGTSYDVRCFIADKTDEKFHRRTAVKMGVRVIYRTDVYHHANGPDNFGAFSSQGTSPPSTAALTSPPSTLTNTVNSPAHTQSGSTTPALASALGGSCSAESNTSFEGTSGSDRAQSTQPTTQSHAKPRKSERGDSFPKLRLSPKSFRFSGRFGRSKSEIEKCPSDPFYNYSKSFQEYDSTAAGGGGGGAGVGVGIANVPPPHSASLAGGCAVGGVIGGNAATAMAGALSCGGGPQGAVDKPFLLQDGRVGLQASLDKAWYTHGEEICVTVNIKNDSRKTVRKVRVNAIQHVDVCMFNNGKFKNVVADSDTSSPVDRTVPPGGTLNTTVILKPQRGQTKNWIALEDTLQHATELEEVNGVIAASAIRSPNLILAPGQAMNPCHSPAVGIPQPTGYHGHGVSGNVGDDRNVFAIYVSYYVKVKLTLSSMGGELSLKLPFVLVHVEEPRMHHIVERLALDDVPAGKRSDNKVESGATTTAAGIIGASARKDGNGRLSGHAQHLDRIESVDDEIRLPIPEPDTPTTISSNNNKRKLVRSETLAKDLEEEIEEQVAIEARKSTLTSAENSVTKEDAELEQVHVVQIHAHETVGKEAQSEEAKQQMMDTEAKEDVVLENTPSVVDKQQQTVDQPNAPITEEIVYANVQIGSTAMEETPNVDGLNPQATNV